MPSTANADQDSSPPAQKLVRQNNLLTISRLASKSKYSEDVTVSTDPSAGCQAPSTAMVSVACGLCPLRPAIDCLSVSSTDLVSTACASFGPSKTRSVPSKQFVHTTAMVEM